MKYIFKRVLDTCQKQIQVIRNQYDLKMPPELVWSDNAVIVDFRQGCKWL